MNRPAAHHAHATDPTVPHARRSRLARVSLELVGVALLVAAPSAARAQDIAVYGAENLAGFGSQAHTYDQTGQSKTIELFQLAPGNGSSAISSNIEDFAYDSWGRVYALGKLGSNGARTVFKSSAVPGTMMILFQTSATYDASVDGSIAILPTGDIAVYGAENIGGSLGSNVTVYDQAGNVLKVLLFQAGVGSLAYTLSTNIEDIACDAAGTLYAIGKDPASNLRTIFRSGPSGQMEILFQKTLPYDATVDGSIAISPTGEISVYGAQSVQTFGTSLQTFNAAGTMLAERLFQNSAVGTSFGVNTSIEDIAYDSAGNLYAVGKPNSDSMRTIFKSGANGFMDYLFQTSTYSSAVDGSIAVAPFAAWSMTFGSVAGSNGILELEGTGTLAVGSSNQIRLSHAKPASIATLLIGLSALNAPFKGGFLIPDPTMSLLLATDASGTALLPFVMPLGFPSGLSFYFQCWQPDAGAYKGYAASNGLEGVTP